MSHTNYANKQHLLLKQPEVIWADGAGDAKCTHDSVKYWKSPEFLSWLYNDSPVKMTVLANSRWGSPAIGDYQTGGDRWSVHNTGHATGLCCPL